MASNTNGFTQEGERCRGVSLEIGPPFVLPPTFTTADGDGNVQVTLVGQQCLAQSVDLPTCGPSNVVILAPID